MFVQHIHTQKNEKIKEKNHYRKHIGLGETEIVERESALDRGITEGLLGNDVWPETLNIQSE